MIFKLKKPRGNVMPLIFILMRQRAFDAGKPAEPVVDAANGLCGRRRSGGRGPQHPAPHPVPSHEEGNNLNTDFT